MSALVDEFGRPIGRQQLEKIFDTAANVYEGILNIQIFDDAIEAKGTCAHCFGPIEGVLRFPEGYRVKGFPERERDAAKQLAKRVQRDHFCISRVQAGKLPMKDWLKRFD